VIVFFARNYWRENSLNLSPQVKAINFSHNLLRHICAGFKGLLTKVHECYSRGAFFSPQHKSFTPKSQSIRLLSSPLKLLRKLDTFGPIFALDRTENFSSIPMEGPPSFPSIRLAFLGCCTFQIHFSPLRRWRAPGNPQIRLVRPPPPLPSHKYILC